MQTPLPCMRNTVRGFILQIFRFTYLTARTIANSTKNRWRAKLKYRPQEKKPLGLLFYLLRLCKSIFYLLMTDSVFIPSIGRKLGCNRLVSIVFSHRLFSKLL